MPPDESFSSHVENLIREDNAKLEGKETVHFVDVDRLQAQLLSLARRDEGSKQTLKDLNATKRVRQFSKDYGLTKFNGTEVIMRLLLRI